MFGEYIGKTVSLGEFENVARDKWFYISDLDRTAGSTIGILRGVFDSLKDMKP